MDKINTLNVPGLGAVTYKKLGDLTASELNDALTNKSVTHIDKKTGKTLTYSHY